MPGGPGVPGAPGGPGGPSCIGHTLPRQKTILTGSCWLPNPNTWLAALPGWPHGVTLYSSTCRTQFYKTGGTTLSCVCSREVQPWSLIPHRNCMSHKPQVGSTASAASRGMWCARAHLGHCRIHCSAQSVNFGLLLAGFCLVSRQETQSALNYSTSQRCQVSCSNAAVLQEASHIRTFFAAVSD